MGIQVEPKEERGRGRDSLGSEGQGKSSADPQGMGWDGLMLRLEQNSWDDEA